MNTFFPDCWPSLNLFKGFRPLVRIPYVCFAFTPTAVFGGWQFGPSWTLTARFHEVFSLFGIATAVLAHTFSFITSQCLSESVRGVSWDLMWQNLFLVIVHSAIRRNQMFLNSIILRVLVELNCATDAHSVLINNRMKNSYTQNENLVLDSWLVSFHSDDNWKWIYHLPCVHQTTAPHQNQRGYRFTCSGRFLCWYERCPFIVTLRCYW